MDCFNISGLLYDAAPRSCCLKAPKAHTPHAGQVLLTFHALADITRCTARLGWLEQLGVNKAAGITFTSNFIYFVKG